MELGDGSQIEWIDGTDAYHRDTMVPSYLGFNLGDPNEVANPLVDLGTTQPLYYINSSPATMDDATGDVISGDTYAAVMAYAGQRLALGTYNVSWTGTGTGPSSFDVVANDTIKLLSFSGQIEDLQIQKSDAVGVYTPTFATRATRMRAIRMKDIWMTDDFNYDPTHPWNRIVVSGATTTHFKILQPADIVALANTYNLDVWINIHHLATDANITSLIGGFTTLNGDLFIEHSNEPWNSDLPQYSYAATQSAGYAGSTTVEKIMAWHADRTNAIGALARAAWDTDKIQVTWTADESTPSIVETVEANAQSDLSEIDNYAICQYLGGSWSRAQTANDILALSNDEIAAQVTTYAIQNKVNANSWKSRADARDKKLHCYAGGSDLTHSDNFANQYLLQASQSQPMRAVYDEHLDWWISNMQTLFLLYRDVANDATGHLQYELEAASPRWTSALNRTSGHV